MAAPASSEGNRQPSAEPSWQTLSARYGGTPIDQTWQEGVPAWIRLPVRQWLLQQLS
jgi:hypothetical protein